jgi:cytidine deaminase
MRKIAFAELDEADRALVRAAQAAREHAYVPYSQHKVGSAVRTKAGTVYAAPNVEVISLQQTVHAERNAVNHMAAAGEREIDAVVCYGPYSGVPCAECRQAIWEFSGNDPDTRVIGCTLDDAVELMTMGELYPWPYGPETKGVDPRQW